MVDDLSLYRSIKEKQADKIKRYFETQSQHNLVSTIKLTTEQVKEITNILRYNNETINEIIELNDDISQRLEDIRARLASILP